MQEIPRYYVLMFRTKTLVFLVALTVFVCATAAATYAHTNKQRAAAHFRALTSYEAELKIQDLIKVQGAEAAWKFLKATYVQDGVVRLGVNDPHSLAHDVGVGFFRENGISGFNKCDETFTGGCYHGIVKELVIEGKGDAKSVGALCAQQHDPASCAHGAGHGIHEYSTGGLSATLAQCSMFPDDIAKDCAEGVLMNDSWEWNNAELEAHPWKACDGVADDYRFACASAIGNYFSEYHDPDVPHVRKYGIDAVNDMCKKAPSAGMQDACFLRLDQSIARRAVVGQTIDEQCALTDPAHRATCVTVATQFSSMAVQ